jgi:glycerol uptake facilitator-like aquaporin
MKPTLLRRIVAEFTGTLLLLAAVVGSGIMGERLAAGNVALALLANTIATGAALVAIILAFGPISGAHLNPAVTLADAWQGGVAWRETPAYIGAQIAGALVGVATAHLMFGITLFTVSTRVRTGPLSSSASSSLLSVCSLSSGDATNIDPPPFPSLWAPISPPPIGLPHLRPSPTQPLPLLDP